jgi:hypothetical protein
MPRAAWPSMGVLIINNQLHQAQSIYIKASISNISPVIMAEAACSSSLLQRELLLSTYRTQRPVWFLLIEAHIYKVFSISLLDYFLISLNS